MTGSAPLAGAREGRRRVVFVINRYRTYDHRMYETLADAFDLHVIWIHPPPTDEPVPPSLAMAWEIVGEDPKILTPADVARNTKLFRRVARASERCDLIVASTSDSWKARVVYAAALMRGVPIAMRKETWRRRVDGITRGPRGVYWQFQRRVTEYMEKRAAGMLVGGSKAAAFLESRGVPADRILPFRYLHPDLAQRPVDREIVDKLDAIKRGRIAFLYLGRAMHRKGLVPLIRAYRGVLERGRDAVLFVVGEAIADDTGRGGVSTDYVAEARRLAAGESRIVFVGHVQPTAVNSYYAAADVFVHPHVATVNGADVHEGWGQVITEAACMSKPIVTTDRVASAFDIVIPDRTGYLIRAENIDDELPAALATFIDQPALAGEFGRHARARFEEFVDPRLNVASLETLIERGRA